MPNATIGKPKPRWLLNGLAALAAFASGILSSAKSAMWGRSIDPVTYRSAQYSSRMAFFAASPGAADVVMLGDSITEFGDWKELFPAVSILNRGISGDTSYGVIDRLSEIEDHNPRLVFLMVGLNDLYLGVPSEIVAENIGRIVDRLHTKHIAVVVESVLFTENDRVTNEKVRRLNDALKERFSFFDLNGVIVSSAGYTWDGVHPNGAAYLRWRDAIAGYLRTDQR